jgi:acyl-CoA-binding protein
LVLAFETAQQKLKTLKSKPSNTILLEFYALYKQATMGDVQGARPGCFVVLTFVLLCLLLHSCSSVCFFV